MRELAVILGLGRMGRIHAEVYKELDIDVIDGNAENWREVLEKDPQYVSITSHDDAHYEQTLAALTTGASVIVEKPLCLHEHELNELAKTGANICCNLPLSTIKLPPEAHYYEADYIWGRADQLNGWRKACPDYSFIHGAGIHMIDAIMRNTSGRRPVTVQCMGERTHGFPSETIITIMGKLENYGSFRVFINAAHNGPHEHRFTCWGQDGLIDMKRWGSDKKVCLRNFLADLQGNMRSTLDASAVCFAAQRSLRNGGTVEPVLYP